MTWEYIGDLILSILYTQTGLPNIEAKQVIMLAISGVFIYLAVGKKFEPLLLLPIGFGIFLVNFPLVPLMGYTEHGTPELIRAFYKYGVEWEIIPCVIFLGLGAMTDFGPLIANPKTLIIGAGAQLGVFVTYIGVLFFGFTLKEAASVGIIGGADGPTTIYLTTKLAPHLHHQAGPAPAGGQCARRLFLHGHGAPHPAAHHEAPHQAFPAQDPNAPAAGGLHPREAVLPLDRIHSHHPAGAGGGAAHGHVHVRQLHARIPRGETSF